MSQIFYLILHARIISVRMQLLYKEDQQLVSKVTQGSIFSNAIATKYTENVYGLIISARCDLEHEGNVDYVYYLPIVDLKQWYENNGKIYLLNKDIEKKKHKLENECIKHKFPFQGISESQLIRMGNAIEKADDKQKYLSLVSEYFRTFEKQFNTSEYKPKQESIDSLLDNLKKNDLKDVILVESWERKKQYKVILLQDLKRVKYIYAIKFGEGLLENQISNQTDNDLLYTDDSSCFYEIVKELSSPFIEFVMQRFSQIFCRIGIEDMENEHIAHMKTIINQK